MTDEFQVNERSSLSSDPVQSDLNAGLAALKQKSYEEAIACLELVAHSSDRQAAVKAQMALVKAYKSAGNVPEAIARCQALSQHSSTRVRQWAADTLPGLLKRQATLAIALEPPIESVEQGAIAPAPVATDDQTGFVPFSVSEQPDLTGFTPLDAPDQASPEPIPDMAGFEDVTGFTPMDPSSPPASPASALEDNPFHLPTETSRSDEEQVPAWSTVEQDAITQFQLPITEIQVDEISTDEEVISNQAESEPMEMALETPAPAEPDLPDTPAIAQEQVERSEPDTPLMAEDNTLDSPMATAPSYPTWRQAERAQKWTNLGDVDRSTLWALAAATAIAPFILLWGMAKIGMWGFNKLCESLYWLIDLNPLMMYGNPIWMIGFVLIVLYATSPWLLDRLLQSVYSAKPLSLDLLSRYSPESSRLLRRLFNQARYPLPTLKILYTNTPVVFSYGNLRRTAHIAISQGALELLEDDEIAALIAAEFAHIKYWDFSLLSWIALLLQLPYQVYWRIGQWGDRQSTPVLRAIAVIVSSLAYGLYWLLRWTGISLARVRHFYSDRAATEATGNPNGLARALLKLTFAVAKDIQRQGYTPPLLDSFDLLLPVSSRASLTLGTLGQHSPLEPLLDWDRRNPYRRWLAVNQSHPPLGDRLQHLASYAQRWRLTPELDLTLPPRSAIAALKRDRDFWVQLAPFAGLLGGLALAYLLWLIGAVGDRVGWTLVRPLWGDTSLLKGCMLVGFSLGIFLRINRFYPDIKAPNTHIDPSLVEYMVDAYTLPVDSQPVKIQGTLLGCRGLLNALGQDLLLKTNQGLIRLHFVSPLGTPGNLIPQGAHPFQAIQQTVVVTGWLHRGITPWIDVELIRPQRGKLLKSSHPLWLTFLATAVALSGLLILVRGT